MGHASIPDGRILKLENTTSQSGSDNSRVPYRYHNRDFKPGGSRGWSTSKDGLDRVARAGYLHIQGNTLWWKSYRDVFPYRPINNLWMDTKSNAFGGDKIYAVQTNTKVIERCLLMASDPGDLVLDPTCGSGTTAFVSEQWGRRWIAIDTSRVALAISRQRLMAARFPAYLLMDIPSELRDVTELGRTYSEPVHPSIWWLHSSAKRLCFLTNKCERETDRLHLGRKGVLSSKLMKAIIRLNGWHLFYQ